MKNISTAQDYLEQFAGENIRENAHRQALDIRKFEIDLYWKRTAYFWTLIAATFAGYIATMSNSKDPMASLLVSSVGLCFSVGWYFVNRGSKYWQGNWERHVDLLENEFVGPLYKITPSREEYKFMKLNSAYPFSVSRINQILSLFVALIWVALYGASFYKSNWFPIIDNLLSWILVFLVGGCLVCLGAFGRTKKSEIEKSINFECREYKGH
ncbi:hypothetical protein IMCC1989_2588 [gamma proteobacterium IMCC1989]|nr:hypothetical protein IMCC1989_2588 [gamma proteobacterium IMCC1989]